MEDKKQFEDAAEGTPEAPSSKRASKANSKTRLARYNKWWVERLQMRLRGDPEVNLIDALGPLYTKRRESFTKAIGECSYASIQRSGSLILL